jgi:hypothetical protein
MKYYAKMHVFIIIIILLIIIIFTIFFISKNKNLNKYIIKKCILQEILYIKNVLSYDEFSIINKECINIYPKLILDNSMAKNRLHVIIPKNNIIEKIFYGNKFINLLKNNMGLNIKPSKLLPIEFRYYGINSSMDWHRDQIINKNIYNCPQIEVVYTVHNKSDSKTEWINDKNGYINEVYSVPNSIMITQGNSSFHRVTPIKNGNRSIIKIAYDIESK